MRSSLLVLLLMVSVGCATAPPAPTDADVERAVSASAEAWVAAYERADAAAVASMFHPDGMYAANSGEVLRGRDEIREGLTRWIALRPSGVDLDLAKEPLRITFDGNSAHDLSRFIIRAVPVGCIIDAGHALAVWRPSDDGTWKIETLAVNRDRISPEGACDPTWR